MAEKKPTPKQISFAEHIAMGLNPSDAYRAAGYKADKPETVATEAYRLLRNPQISPIIEKLQNEGMTDAARKRAVLLDRLEAVNERAYDEITENGVNGAHRAYQAFIETFDKLDAMYPKYETWYSIANAENAARKGQWDALFDESPAWFKDDRRTA